jgi:hypothetical protein
MGKAMDSVTSLTHRCDRALVYATHVHGEARKGTSIRMTFASGIRDHSCTRPLAL